MATARELIDAITELATGLPDGMDTEVEFGIGDGKNVPMVDKMDRVAAHLVLDRRRPAEGRIRLGRDPLLCPVPWDCNA